MTESRNQPSEQLTQSELDKSWAKEIAVRVDDIDSGGVDTVSSSELWKKLGGKPNSQN